MSVRRVAAVSLPVIAAVAALVIRRQRHRTSLAAADQRDIGWDLADDFTQAAANSLPDESGAFNIPDSLRARSGKEEPER